MLAFFRLDGSGPDLFYPHVLSYFPGMYLEYKDQLYFPRSCTSVSDLGGTTACPPAAVFAAVPDSRVLNQRPGTVPLCPPCFSSFADRIQPALSAGSLSAVDRELNPSLFLFLSFSFAFRSLPGFAAYCLPPNVATFITPVAGCQARVRKAKKFVSTPVSRNLEHPAANHRAHDGLVSPFRKPLRSNLRLHIRFATSNADCVLSTTQRLVAADCAPPQGKGLDHSLPPPHTKPSLVYSPEVLIYPPARSSRHFPLGCFSRIAGRYLAVSGQAGSGLPSEIRTVFLAANLKFRRVLEAQRLQPTPICGRESKFAIPTRPCCLLPPKHGKHSFAEQQLLPPLPPADSNSATSSSSPPLRLRTPRTGQAANAY